MFKTYRSRPCVVRAARYCSKTNPMKGIVYEADPEQYSGYFVVDSLHGQVVVKDGDWIIKEPVEGKYYPCKPTVFETKYEGLETV